MRDPEQPPRALIDEANAAFERRFDGDVAALVFDSLVDENDPPESHSIRFEHARLRVELDLCSRSDGTDVQGRIDHQGPRQVALQIRGAPEPVVSEVVEGSFSFTRVGHGMVRLSLGDGEEPLWTEWFRL